MKWAGSRTASMTKPVADLDPSSTEPATKKESKTMTEIAHFIDNARVAGTSGRSQSVFNPATGAAEKTVALATRAEVGRAVAAAAAAWPTWAKTPSLRRA